jgi:hypothetical protein
MFVDASRKVVDVIAERREMQLKTKLKPETTQSESKLSESDIRCLLIVCTEFVHLCARLTGAIDPAAAAMLAYVRDDIRLENKTRIP